VYVCVCACALVCVCEGFVRIYPSIHVNSLVWAGSRPCTYFLCDWRLYANLPDNRLCCCSLSWVGSFRRSARRPCVAQRLVSFVALAAVFEGQSGLTYNMYIVAVSQSAAAQAHNRGKVLLISWLAGRCTCWVAEAAASKQAFCACACACV
jgi:hypothetical protein